MEIPSFVICRTAKVKHTVVTETQNRGVFLKWAYETLTRLYQGEIIHISLDTEGYMLGLRHDSLGLIQFAECFSSDITKKGKRKKRGEDKISINMKPGFLILMPVPCHIKRLLSLIFSHENLRILTFDFTCDLAAILDSGINVRTRNILDAQVTSERDPMSFFEVSKNQNLKNTAKRGYNCVEYKSAIAAIEGKSKIDFSKLHFDHREDEDKRTVFKSLLTNDFWVYSSSDIVLTAIAFVGLFDKLGYQKVVKFSEQKVIGFDKIMKWYGPLGPSLKKCLSYATSALKNLTIRNKNDAYDLYNKAELIKANSEVYQKLFIESKRVSASKVDKTLESSLKYLAEHEKEEKHHHSVDPEVDDTDDLNEEEEEHHDFVNRGVDDSNYLNEEEEVDK